jgi:hypothetical protein
VSVACPQARRTTRCPRRHCSRASPALHPARPSASSEHSKRCRCRDARVEPPMALVRHARLVCTVAADPPGWPCPRSSQARASAGRLQAGRSQNVLQPSISPFIFDHCAASHLHRGPRCPLRVSRLCASIYDLLALPRPPNFSLSAHRSVRNGRPLDSFCQARGSPCLIRNASYRGRRRVSTDHRPANFWRVRLDVIAREPQISMTNARTPRNRSRAAAIITHCRDFRRPKRNTLERRPLPS